MTGLYLIIDDLFGGAISGASTLLGGNAGDIITVFLAIAFVGGIIGGVWFLWSRSRGSNGR